jgi:hypothetical protein
MPQRFATLLSAAAVPFLLAAAPPTTQPQRTAAAPVAAPAPVAPAASNNNGNNNGAAAVSPHSALSRRLPEIKFNQITLADAVDFLRDVSGANIHVNWRALEAMGIDRQTPVSMQLSDVPMRRVLRSLLDECGGPNQLTYYVDDDVIEITSRELADSQLVTRVDPVEDLVMVVPNFNDAPVFDLSNQTNQASGAGGGGGQSQSLFGSQGSQGQEPQQTTKLQRGEALVDLIKSTIQPEVWRDNGGTASIRYFTGHLIVTAPRSVQEAIGGKP